MREHPDAPLYDRRPGTEPLITRLSRERDEAVRRNALNSQDAHRFCVERDDARAEVSRLREALIWIAGMNPCGSDPADQFERARAAVYAAREALEAGGGETKP